jgi:hypothetical protein
MIISARYKLYRNMYMIFSMHSQMSHERESMTTKVKDKAEPLSQGCSPKSSLAKPKKLDDSIKRLDEDLAANNAQLQAQLAETTENLEKAQDLLTRKNGEILVLKADLYHYLQQVVASQQRQIQEMNGFHSHSHSH